MKKLAFLTLALVIVLTMASSVWAEDPAGEFAVIQQAADEYLSSGKPPVIKAPDLFENLNDGDASNDPFVLSVRTPDHYAIGHIAGATNIYWREVAKPENLAKLPTDIFGHQKRRSHCVFPEKLQGVCDRVLCRHAYRGHCGTAQCEAHRL